MLWLLLYNWANILIVFLEIILSLNLEFWGAGTARTLRPIWMAEELDLKYTLYPFGPRTGETQTEEYRKLNPKQKIPLLRHEDFVLSESIAICRYLQRISDSSKIFIPKNNMSMAQEDEWCNFIYGELDETSLYVMRRHYDLKSIYGDAPKVVDTCRNYFLKQLQVVENILKDQNTLFGYDFGLADILLATCLDWAKVYEFELPKNVLNYHNRIKSRKAYQKAFEINYKR